MKLKFLALLSFIFFALQAQAEFFYDPIIVILQAPNGKGDAVVKVINPMGKPTRVQLSLTEWESSKDNTPVIKARKEGEESILDYIKLSPKQINLAPKQEKVIRIACNLPTSYENKEYKLILSMLEIGSDRKALDIPDAQRSYGLIVNRESRAATYIWKGRDQDLKSELSIKEAIAKKEDFNEAQRKIDKKADLPPKFGISYTLNYQNTGNIHTRQTVGVRFYEPQGKLVLEIPKVGIMPAFPTKADEAFNFHGSFVIPPELDASKPYELEFVMIERMSDATGQTEKAAKVIKSSRVRV